MSEDRSGTCRNRGSRHRCAEILGLNSRLEPKPWVGDDDNKALAQSAQLMPRVLADVVKASVPRFLYSGIYVKLFHGVVRSEVAARKNIVCVLISIVASWWALPTFSMSQSSAKGRSNGTRPGGPV